MHRMNNSGRLLKHCMPDKLLQKVFILPLIFVFALLPQAKAQTKDSITKVTKDSAVATLHNKDTVTKKKFTLTKLEFWKGHPYPYPKLAMLCSIVLPGLGQAYNKTYWKIPVIYAGLGTMAYFIIWNNNQYQNYNSALKLRNNGGIDQYYNIYSASDLVSIESYYNRDFWLSVMGASLIYILNIVDANVDAQLHSFDVSDNISLNILPLVSPYGFQPTFCLVKRF